MGTQSGMDASGIAPTCPNPTIPMLSIERLCPLGAQSSAFTFPNHKIKRYRGTDSYVFNNCSSRCEGHQSFISEKRKNE
jgi:hypothetical protein